MTPEQLKVILSAEDRTASAFSSAGRLVAKMGNDFDVLKAQAIGALGVLAVPVSAAGLVSFFNSARQAVGALKDLEDATGASVERISALDSIARSTGSNIDTVGAALVKLNSALKDSEPNKGAGAVLKALNLDIAELKKLDPAEALRKVAVALSGYADNGEKARAVQELFGKSVREVGPFLKDLAEAKRLDAKLTADQVEQIDRADKAINKLGATYEDAKRTLYSGIAAELNAVIEKFAQAEKAGRSFMSVLFLSPEQMDLKNRRAGVFAEQARAELKALESAPFRMRDDDPRMIAARQRVLETDRAAGIGGAGRGFVNPPSALILEQPKKPNLTVPQAPSGLGRSSIAARAEDPDAAFKRYRDNMQKGIEAAQNMSAVETALRDIQLGRLGQVSEAQRDEILNLARVNEALESGKEATKLLEQADRDAATAKKELQEAGQRYFEATRTDQEKLLANLAEIDRLQQAGAISAETAGRAMAAAYGQAASKVRELTEEEIEAKRLAAQFQSAFSNAAGDVIFRSNSAAEAVRNLGREIARIIIQQQVIKPAADDFGGFLARLVGGGGTSRGIDSFNVWETYDGGGYTGSGARSGGLDGRGGFPAILHPNETVVDHSRGQGMGGGVSITYQIDARGADVGSELRMRQALKENAAQTKADIMASLNRGGSWARATGRA